MTLGNKIRSLLNGAHYCSSRGELCIFSKVKEELIEKLFIIKIHQAANHTGNSWLYNWLTVLALSECSLCWIIGRQLNFSFIFKKQFWLLWFKDETACIDKWAESLLQDNEHFMDRAIVNCDLALYFYHKSKIFKYHKGHHFVCKPWDVLGILLNASACIHLLPENPV